jgi:hypothetical protein
VEYRRLEAPREDGAALVEPTFPQVPATIAANLERRSGYQFDFFGRTFADLSRQAREELHREATAWTASYRDVVRRAFDPSQKFLLAGHQPQLFHPGVWFKNFALGSLAAEHDAVAINLIVDSDTVKSTALRVPGGPVGHPHTALVPFDDKGPVIPFEERAVRSPETFHSFGDRAARQIAGLVPNPLVREYWPLAAARLAATGNLGAALAQSRHQLEGQWGAATLEIPQSRVCQLPAFAWFTAFLFADLARLRDAYNESVHEFRRLHHIRSTAHPVPDLAMEGPWIEAPYWIWTREDPQRRRLFVCRRGREMLLTNRSGLEIRLPAAEGDPEAAVERLLDLPRQGIRLRCRALITTLWARLFLSDLFLHGIGGAKYDQVTDALIARWFGLEPPGFMVLSATLQLPAPRRRVTAEHARDLARQLRELTWHPEVAVRQAIQPGNCKQAEELIAAKSRWVGTAQTPENAHARWQEIRRINEALQPWVAKQRERLLLDRAALSSALKAEGVLSWREYAFCLYPERLLRDFFALTASVDP